MDPQRWERIKQLFQEAVEADDRETFLEVACRNDPETRAEVEALLAADAEVEPSRGAPAVPVEVDEQPGTLIGPYKILQRLGEGGFGVVYMAEQTEPVRRRVALKVIKLGMDTRQVVARFEAERQALALMDHPNIARVFDAGATEGGRPYFVMELVKGVPITQYCDDAKLDTRARLALFRSVCAAIQHAHQKGIIHRDLKPNNVLVALHDGEAVPKVIDFGIAKATDRQLTEKTLFTEFRQMIGTPEYMAPEQAEMSGLDVDTRADIYSLGVMLYELLTGTKPMDLKEVLSDGYEALLRTIKELDPPKPSTRISTLGQRLVAIARQRDTRPAMLGKQLRGELDWIVMRSMEKDRRRRYETANALAMDVQRYLNDEPVHAGPPSALYRARKYVRRNRVGVTIAAGVFLALSTGIAFAGHGYFEAKRETRLADDARTRWLNRKRDADEARTAVREQRDVVEREAAAAQTQVKKAETVVTLVREMLTAANPRETKGPNYTVQAFLDDFARDLGKRLESEPEVEATVRNLVGAAYMQLGEYGHAQAHVDRVLSMGGLPANERADGLLTAASLARLRGDFEDAEAKAREALAARGKSAAPGQRVRDLLQLAFALSYRGLYDEAKAVAGRARPIAGDDDRLAADVIVLLGTVDVWAGYAQRGARQLEEALRRQRRVFGEEHPTVAQTMGLLGQACLRAGDPLKAERFLRAALELVRRVSGDDHYHTASIWAYLAEAQASLERLAEAESSVRKAIGIHRESLGNVRSTALLENQLGIILNRQGRFAEAEQIHKRNIELFTRREEPRDLASALANLSSVYRGKGRLLEAIELRKRALALWGEGSTHPQALITRASIGSLCRSAGLYEESERELRAAAQGFRETLGERHPHVTHCERQLALTLVSRGEGRAAVDLARRCLARVEETFGKESIPAVRARNSLVFCLNHAGQAREAVEVSRGMVAALEAAYGKNHPDVGNALTDRAMSLANAGRFEEAARATNRAVQIARTVYGEAHTEYVQALRLSASILLDLGKLEVARERLNKARRIAEALDECPLMVRAWILRALASVELKTDQYGPAVALSEEAVRLAREAHGDGPHPQVASVIARCAEAHRKAGNLDRAEELRAECLKIRRAVYGEKGTASDLTALARISRKRRDFSRASAYARKAMKANPKDVGAVVAMAEIHEEQADWKRAVVMRRRALGMSRESYGDDSPWTTTAVFELARAQLSAGQVDPAAAGLRAALAAHKRRHGEQHFEVPKTMALLARACLIKGDLDGAHELAARALQLTIEALGPDHAIVAGFTRLVGELELRRGKSLEGERLLRRVIELAPDGTQEFYSARRLLASHYNRLALPDKARPFFEEIVETGQRKGNVDPLNRAIDLANYGYCLDQLGDLEKAKTLTLQGLAVLDKAYGNRDLLQRASVQINLVSMLMRLGERDEALAVGGHCVATFQRLGPSVVPAHVGVVPERLGDAKLRRDVIALLRRGPQTDGHLATLGHLLILDGQHAAAVPVLRRCLAIRKRDKPDSWFRYNAESLLGEALAGVGKHDEAGTLLLSGYENMKPPERSAPRKQQALDRIIAFYERTKQPEKAAAWRAKIIK
jgi:serine/threonine protein kinase/tetratricopeptide (TPR) repeat protein